MLDGESQFFHITSLVDKCVVTDSDTEAPTLNLGGVDDTGKLIIAYGVARGMQHLHSLNIFHRDLKLLNILYDANGPRIADLGWAKAVKRGEDQSGRRGTFAYAAPEVLNQSCQYDLPADVYSYGCCLWELMTGRLWITELAQRYSGYSCAAIMNEIETHRLRPPLDDPQSPSSELLRRCFGADVNPERRPSFADIVGLLETRPTDYFPNPDIGKFIEYKERVSRPIEPADENLKYLLGQLTNIIHFADGAGLPPGSPYLDQILSCLGLLFGDEGQKNQDVILIARYQILTKGSLDGSEFLRELDAIDSFPPGRPNFGLGDFLIDSTQKVAPNRQRTTIPIPNRNELFRVLRNILAGICCDHPCVLKVHGWNIEQGDEGFSVLIETDEAKPVSFEQFKVWPAVDQSKFLLSAAIGVTELHCYGVFHNNLGDEGSIQVKNGRAQICNFGLLDETASFETDTVACQVLFSYAAEEYSHLVCEMDDVITRGRYETDFRGYIRGVLKYGGQVPFQDFARDIAAEAKPRCFPFDLFFHLVHFPELWRSAERSVDVGTALAELTRGLGPRGKARFAAKVNDQMAAHVREFLPPGFFK
jgi:serine/threonine protein kinase